MTTIPLIPAALGARRRSALGRRNRVRRTRPHGLPRRRTRQHERRRGTLSSVRQELEQPVDLEASIIWSRVRTSRAPSRLPSRSRDLLALNRPSLPSSRAALRFRLAMMPALAPFVSKACPFHAAQGQPQSGLRHCHDYNWDKRLAGSATRRPIRPAIRCAELAWQSLGSLQRRLRGCILRRPAQPYAFVHHKLVDLELYLTSAGEGACPVETPAVRPEISGLASPARPRPFRGNPLLRGLGQRQCPDARRSARGAHPAESRTARPLITGRHRRTRPRASRRPAADAHRLACMKPK